MSKTLLTLITFVCISVAAFSQANNVRGFFVTNSDAIIGNTTSENDLLTYAQSNGFNYLAMYDLSGLNWTSSTVKTSVANFIKKAKTQYGITQIGACTEVYSFHRDFIIPYNNERTAANEKFDILYFEFEFWVPSAISNYYCSKYLTPAGYSCDSAGAFRFAMNEFQQIDNAAAANGMTSEFYMGWPNKGQMQQIVARADRILLSAYRVDDSDIYIQTRNRLIDIASSNVSVKVISMYSAEPAFMGPWLNTHTITQPYNTYTAAYTAETGTWKQYINLQGYHWFNFSYLPRTASVVATVTASGATSFCTGGSVTLTANSGSGYTYQWLKNGSNISGATGVSYVATASGAYSVKVTSGSLNATSSSITVTAGSSVSTPTITANGPTSFCPGGSVTLTSSAASAYLWTTGATTQSITVATAGSYNVTVGSGACTAVSSNITVSTGGVSIPVITAGGSLSFCPGGSVTLTSSSATGNVWSNGATTQSIVVSTSGNYSVTVTSGSCSATSSAVTVSATSAPSTPTITVTGSTSICPGSGVTLTSSTASGYVWSNGATTRAIVATTGGSYWVKAYVSSTCFAQSSSKTVTLLTAPSKPTVSVTSGSLNLESGQSVTLKSSSSTSYKWSTNAVSQSITTSSQGTYRVTAFNSSGCGTISDPVVVKANGCTPPAVPTISITSGSTVLTSGQSVVLKASEAGGWLWSNGKQTQSITVTTAGTYYVRAYNAGGCSTASLPITVYVVAARVDGSNLELSVYPNPVSEQLNVRYTVTQESDYTVRIVDLMGREVYSQKVSAIVGENHSEINVSEFTTGMYLVYISNEVEEKHMKIMVK